MFYSIAIPALLAFLVTLALGPAMINFLHKLKFGQFIREEGPASHQKKSGTPTMGGILFLIGIIAGSAYYCVQDTKVLAVLLVTLGFGIIGFLDDYIKVVMKRNLGLTERQKLLGQLIITGLFAFYMVRFSDLGTDIAIPFLHEKTIELGWFYVPVLLFVVIGTANGANFTDGLDGLASSVTAVISVFMIVASLGHKAGIHPVASAVLGALLGFLCFNTYPAKVFMGDTGSLALGGFVAASSFILKMPLFLPFVAFIYFIEVLSVIIQVAYFKKTKKRIFKMAPIHHHFELSGWPETKVVSIFMVVTAALCLLALLAM